MENECTLGKSKDKDLGLNSKVFWCREKKLQTINNRLK